MKWTKTFKGDGTTFSAISEATAWLQRNGYSVGSMCGPSPIGVMRGDYSIAKWRNLSTRERSNLDGQIACDGRSYREGSVTLTLNEAPPEDT